MNRLQPTHPHPGSLRSQVYSTDLTLTFQDYGYAIDSSLKSISFAFASTDYPEYVGIDSVRITGGVASVPDPSILLKPSPCSAADCSGLYGRGGVRNRLTITGPRHSVVGFALPIRRGPN